MLLNDPELMPITLLVGVLEDTYGTRCPLTTRQMRDMATDRKLPLLRLPTRWAFRRGDVPQIAEIIGMISPASSHAD